MSPNHNLVTNYVTHVVVCVTQLQLKSRHIAMSLTQLCHTILSQIILSQMLHFMSHNPVTNHVTQGVAAAWVTVQLVLAPSVVVVP